MDDLVRERFKDYKRFFEWWLSEAPTNNNKIIQE